MIFGPITFMVQMGNTGETVAAAAVKAASVMSNFCATIDGAHQALFWDFRQNI